LVFEDHFEDLLTGALIFGFGGVATRYLDNRRTREIFDFGDGFLIKENGKEVYVELAQIHDVDWQTYGHDKLEVTLEIAYETKLGDRFTFFPTSEAMAGADASRYVDYLNQRIERAKNGE
jgi:hypothetical protein